LVLFFSFQQQQTGHEDDGTYANGFVQSYQQYPGGAIQTIYTRAPSSELKDVNKSLFKLNQNLSIFFFFSHQQMVIIWVLMVPHHLHHHHQQALRLVNKFYDRFFFI
jgi:hypothetical protein